jgi:hypothetical protein
MKIEWKLFAIVLAFHILKSFIFDQNSYTNNDLITTAQYFEFILIQLPRIIFDLLFWVCIIPFIIFAVEDYLTKKQKLIFYWKNMILRYFVPLFTYKFLFSIFGFLALCFSSIFMLNIASKLEPDFRIIAGFIGISSFQLILSSGWFIIYNAAIVGFYLRISKREDIQGQKTIGS